MRPAALLPLAATAAALAGAVWHWPARSLQPLLPDRITCARVGGTLWNGHCAGLAVDGRTLGNLQWLLRPSRLLQARLAARVRLVGPAGEVGGEIAKRVGGSVEATGVAADFDLQRAALPGLPADLGGRLVADLPSLRLAGGTLAASGRVELTALVRGTQPGLQLGGYELVLEPPQAGSPPAARVQDLGGPLWVRARLTWMPPAGYLLQGEVQARASASAALRRELERLGPADPQGRHSFAQEASL